MASLRFSFTNKVQTATLKNGTGGGAPALDQVSPWLMTNSQNRDRELVWQQSSGASGFVDFDLTGAASDTSVGLLAVLGHRGAPATAAGVTSIVTRYSTNANGYPPTAASAWTAFTGGTITLGSGVRDAGAIIATPINCRYIRFDYTTATTFTIGRLFAGTVEHDFLIVASPGRSRRRIIPRLENRMAGGMPHYTVSGDVRYEFSLPYQDIGATLFAKILAVGSRTTSFVLIERDDAIFEAVLRDGTLTDSLTFDAPDTYTTALDVETLG